MSEFGINPALLDDARHTTEHMRLSGETICPVPGWPGDDLFCVMREENESFVTLHEFVLEGERFFLAQKRSRS